MFPEHADRGFLDPEYSSLQMDKYSLYSPNTLKYVREQMVAQLRTGVRVTKGTAAVCGVCPMSAPAVLGYTRQGK